MWHDLRMRFHRQLTDAYRFTGFRPLSSIRGIFGDPQSRVVRLSRRGKKQTVEAATKYIDHSTTANCAEFEIYLAAIAEYIWSSKFDACYVGNAER
jgi:hypothetical protein